MIVSMPTHCTMFVMRGTVPMGESFGVAHFLTTLMRLKAPVSLKVDDRLLIDLQTKNVEIVERKGFVIWRSGWLN